MRRKKLFRAAGEAPRDAPQFAVAGSIADTVGCGEGDGFFGGSVARIQLDGLSKEDERAGGVAFGFEGDAVLNECGGSLSEVGAIGEEHEEEGQSGALHSAFDELSGGFGQTWDLFA